MALSLALVAGILAAPASAGIADLDPSWGSGGTVRQNLGTNNDFAGDLFVAPSGRTYLLAYIYDIQNGGEHNPRRVIARFTSRGALDGSFGSGGKLVIPVANFGDFGPACIVVDEDQQLIYLGGGAIGVMDGNNSRFGIMRMSFSGQFDTGFGTNGIATIEAPVTNGTYSYDNLVGDLLFQPDGKILAVGVRMHITDGSKAALARFSATGQPETSFGAPNSLNGFLQIDFGQKEEFAAGAALTDAGEIVLSAKSGSSYGNGQLVVARLTAGGVLDGTFGSGGYYVDSVGDLHSVLAPRVGANGSITVAGSSYVAGNSGFPNRNYVVRYTTAGARDLSYGAGGLLAEADPVRYVIPGTLHPSGRILTAYTLSANGPDVYDAWIDRMVGSVDLQVPGYVEPRGANGSSSGALGWQMLAILLAVGLRRRIG